MCDCSTLSDSQREKRWAWFDKGEELAVQLTDVSNSWSKRGVSDFYGFYYASEPLISLFDAFMLQVKLLNFG